MGVTFASGAVGVFVRLESGNTNGGVIRWLHRTEVPGSSRGSTSNACAHACPPPTAAPSHQIRSSTSSRCSPRRVRYQLHDKKSVEGLSGHRPTQDIGLTPSAAVVGGPRFPGKHRSSSSSPRCWGGEGVTPEKPGGSRRPCLPIRPPPIETLGLTCADAEASLGLFVAKYLVVPCSFVRFVVFMR